MDTAAPTSSDTRRLTFELPREVERAELDHLAREHDLTLAQICRRGVRLVVAELSDQGHATA